MGSPIVELALDDPRTELFSQTDGSIRAMGIQHHDIVARLYGTDAVRYILLFVQRQDQDGNAHISPYGVFVS
jgi:hypothetical protein